MDNNDQRNGNVPRGTFNKENGADAADLLVVDRRTDAERAAGFEHAPKERKRVRTLLGVPLADALPPAAEPQRDSISETIQHLLDEQSSIPIEIDEEEPTTLLDSEIMEMPDSQPPGVFGTNTLREFESGTSKDQRSSVGPLPLLIPGPYAQAEARERRQTDEGTRSDAPANTVHLEVDSHSQTGTTTGTTMGTTGDTAQYRELEIPLNPASYPPLASSLAPREVARAPQPASKDNSPMMGFLMVAAMLLIAGGGWWMTAGSFSRSTGSQALPQQPTVAQPVQPQPAQPAPSVVAAVEATPAPAQALASSAPLQPTAAEKAGPSGSAKSTRVASRTPRVKPAPIKPTTEGGLPETPTRAEVVSRLESVRTSVRACADGRSGVADLDITIAHSGVVTHVLVGGDFAGTTQGSCIARAVREARFPTFKQERFRLLFPYAI